MGRKRQKSADIKREKMQKQQLKKRNQFKKMQR